MIQMFIENDADTHAEDDKGNTALRLTLMMKQFPVVQLMRKAGARYPSQSSKMIFQYSKHLR